METGRLLHMKNRHDRTPLRSAMVGAGRDAPGGADQARVEEWKERSTQGRGRRNVLPGSAVR